ncbi:peptidoglycan endopeptidase [Pacificimonas sp. ICDLI1SI03]
MIAAARAAIGTPTRVQGRVAGLALDCVGLAALAARAGGVRFEIPSDYSLRSDNRTRLIEGMMANGFLPVETARPGDIVHVEVGPGHHHLAVQTEQGAVHADFGVGRVVEAELPPGWRTLFVWRLEGEER